MSDLKRVEHVGHAEGEKSKDCPACKLIAEAAKAAKLLEPAANANRRRAQSNIGAQRQRELYEASPKLGDAA